MSTPLVRSRRHQVDCESSGRRMRWAYWLPIMKRLSSRCRYHRHLSTRMGLGMGDRAKPNAVCLSTPQCLFSLQDAVTWRANQRTRKQRSHPDAYTSAAFSLGLRILSDDSHVNDLTVYTPGYHVMGASCMPTPCPSVLLPIRWRTPRPHSSRRRGVGLQSYGTNQD